MKTSKEKTRTRRSGDKKQRRVAAFASLHPLDTFDPFAALALATLAALAALAALPTLPLHCAVDLQESTR